MIKRYAASYIQNLKFTLDEIDLNQFEKIVSVLLKAREADKQIFIVGNGGSASTASHFACDLGRGTVNFSNDGFDRFRAISLTDNMALVTAIGNDISYDSIFTEQLKNLMNKGDVLIGITASGNSPNILKSFEYAKKVGAVTIGFLGFGGGKASQIVDYNLTVSSNNYGISEDFHLIIGHILTQIIRRILNEKKQKVMFLDRDGVINENPAEHSYITRWEEFKFIQDIFDTLTALQAKGYRFVVVTNQQGIAKNIFSEADLFTIHENMLDVFRKKNISIDNIYYCPHLETDHCPCRKPNPGLFYRAQNELPFIIDFENSFVIGDSEKDILAGKEFGIKTIYYANSKGQQLSSIQPDYTIKRLLDVLDIA